MWHRYGNFSKSTELYFLHFQFVLQPSKVSYAETFVGWIPLPSSREFKKKNLSLDKLTRPKNWRASWANRFSTREPKSVAVEMAFQLHALRVLRRVPVNALITFGVSFLVIGLCYNVFSLLSLSGDRIYHKRTLQIVKDDLIQVNLQFLKFCSNEEDQGVCHCLKCQSFWRGKSWKKRKTGGT